MVNKIQIFLFVLLAAVGCKKADVVTPPENLIPENEMVSLLTDIHLVEGARTGLIIMGDSALAVKDYYHAYFQKYNVSQAQFDSSFIYYSKLPEQFDLMYEKVIENLSVIESELKSD